MKKDDNLFEDDIKKEVIRLQDEIFLNPLEKIKQRLIENGKLNDHKNSKKKSKKKNKKSK